MSKNKPLVTVVIPVYNRANIVLETLESISLQTLQNWECIIVDDYSTDNSVEVINEYIKNDDRFQLIIKKNENKGAPASRNIGWKAAKSKYIIFLDSDDLLAPWAIKERFSFFEKNEEVDFCVFSNLEFKKNEKEFFYSRTNYGIKAPLQQFLQFKTTWQTSNPIWNKSFLKKINGWDEDALSWQDGEIHIRALAKNANFKWGKLLPDTFLRLDGQEKITNKTSLKKIENNFFIFSKVIQILSEKDKLLFKKNIEILAYNIIERSDYKSSMSLVKLEILKELKLPFFGLKSYVLIYHSTKNIPILRKFIYLIREKLTVFSKRKKFFVKNEIDVNTIDELRLRLKGITLFANNFKWL